MKEEIQAYVQSDAFQALANSTRVFYVSALNRLYDWWEYPEIPACPADAIAGFCQHLKDAGVSGKTIQAYCTVVKAFFRFHGYEVAFTYRIPADERNDAKLKRLNRWFDEVDVALCKDYDFPNAKNDALRARNRVIVRLLTETGCRIRELANVKAEDIDLEEGVIMFFKSKTVPRPSFFSADTGRLIRAYKERATMAGAWQGKVFPSTDQLQNVVNGMLEDLGLKNGTDGRGPHTFRHFVATQLFYDGDMRLEDIAFLLGDEPDTIRKEYIHPTPRMLQERVKKAMGWRHNADGFCQCGKPNCENCGDGLPALSG